MTDIVITIKAKVASHDTDVEKAVIEAIEDRFDGTALHILSVEWEEAS